MVAMFLSRELTGSSFPEIGMRFGGKDHSTVINACRRIQQLREEDTDVQQALEALRAPRRLDDNLPLRCGSAYPVVQGARSPEP